MSDERRNDDEEPEPGVDGGSGPGVTPGDDEEPEPGVDGGSGPGVTPGDVETPGAATTPNQPDEDADDD
jgi:hypothetical protein